jgi:DNA-binding LytR/AlgR family response regulator
MPTALIADDEPQLRAQLKARLADAWPELRIVAEAADGGEALELARLHEPDLAFLDLRMPVRSGPDVARALGSRCHVVFVAAGDEHAIAALAAAAVDHLPQPADDEGLAQFVLRQKARLRAARGDLDTLVARLAGDERGPLRWIRAWQADALRLFAVADVLYFQARDKHTQIVTADAEALVRKPIRELRAALDGATFRQIHRGTIVNLHAIERVERDSHGEPWVVLARRSERLPVSRGFARCLAGDAKPRAGRRLG